MPSGWPDTPFGAFEQSPPDGAFSTLARSVRDFGHFKSRKIRSIGPAAHGWRLLDGEAESPAIAE
jgi:hypothetical protein